MAIDTGKVENRRRLHFDTIQDMADEVERLNRGKVKTLGNWSGGQILRHLTIVMDDSIDGAKARLAWPIQMVGRIFFKRRILTKGMTPGFQLKGQPATVLVPPATSWEEGLHMFRRAIQRQQTETKREPHPFLGPLSYEEWKQLHCRHAELHLSFLLPRERLMLVLAARTMHLLCPA
jgi:hypothetical protein